MARGRKGPRRKEGKHDDDEGAAQNPSGHGAGQPGENPGAHRAAEEDRITTDTPGRGGKSPAERGNQMITQTEIICLAIRALDAEIEVWKTRCKNGGEEGRQIFETATKTTRKKLDALKELYLIQTGEAYAE